MVSCQKGPTRHAYAWQIGPFWQDTLDLSGNLEVNESLRCAHLVYAHDLHRSTCDLNVCILF